MSKNTNLSFLTDYITADITNGRIGINTPSPTVAFDVTGAAKFSGVATAKSLSVVSTNGYSGQIIQQGDIFGTSATNLLIQSSTSNGIGFLVNGGTTFNMFINSTGNVGIGTTSPNSFGGGYRTLAIAGTGTEGGMIQSMVGSTSALFIGTNSSQCFFAEPRNVFMTFSTNDTERMRILANGNVGIGTSAPGYKLQVNGSGYFGSGLTVEGGVSATSFSATAAIVTYNVAQFVVSNNYSFTPPNMLSASSNDGELKMYMVWVWGANTALYGSVRVWMIAVSGPGTAYTVNTLLSRDVGGGSGLDLTRTSATQLTITSNNLAAIKWVSIMQLNTNT